MANITVALIGNPNCGKSTLFNDLTGSEQQIGNWPGVTVERKSGFCNVVDSKVEIVDLPGIYNLSVSDIDSAIDEKIAAEYLLTANPDLIVNVIDASNLERSLYLTTQLLELSIPIVIALNMVDVAKRRHMKISATKLAKQLDCQVLEIVANRSVGIDELKFTIANISPTTKTPSLINYPKIITNAVNSISTKIDNKNSLFLAMRLLEEDYLAKQKVDTEIQNLTANYKKEIVATEYEDIDILVADARYGFIHNIATSVSEKKSIPDKFTTILDKIVLHRLLGIPIFLGVMYLMFYFAIVLGGYLQNICQKWSEIIFIDKFYALLQSLHWPNLLITILTAGLGRGINTTITFIPVLAAMFFFLALLENSGYIARANFVMDRLMRALGLPGKSFIPLLIGFGCNVPAILATRTLESQRDRTLTIIMSPFMSCGARLAIYAIFTAAFFPVNGQNVVFSLYIIGVLIALLTGFILRKTLLPGEHSYLITELPTYHIPRIRDILWQTWIRLRSFIKKAGHIIIPLCMILSILNLPLHMNQQTHSKSMLTYIGEKITPALKPIGINSDNWPAAVGLVTGIMAKEVVVATLNTLYTQDMLTQTPKVQNIDIQKSTIYGQMYKKFASKMSAFAYLLFVLLYFPCIPTLVMIWNELNWRWAVFSLCWNTGIAYSVAALFYQTENFAANPVYAITVSSVIIILFIFMILGLNLVKIIKRSL
jgi:ferrous iron transport protein B